MLQNIILDFNFIRLFSVTKCIYTGKLKPQKHKLHLKTQIYKKLNEFNKNKVPNCTSILILGFLHKTDTNKFNYMQSLCPECNSNNPGYSNYKRYDTAVIEEINEQ